MEEDNPFVTYIPEEDAVDEDPDLDPGDAEDDEQEEYFDDSEESEEVLEQPADLDPAVRQDMTRLEETFRNMGLKFRMIDRIGEGTIHDLSTARFEQVLTLRRNFLHRLQSRRHALRLLPEQLGYSTIGRNYLVDSSNQIISIWQITRSTTAHSPIRRYQEDLRNK